MHSKKRRKVEKNMKNMNKYKYFGSSKVFNRALFAAPIEGEGGGDNGGGAGEGESESNTPTVEELIAKLAQKDADYIKLKNSFDNTSSELSTAKKQLKAKMSAEEQIEEEKRLADEAKDAKIQELESKFRMMDYSKRYMGIGMDEKTAETLSALTGELEDADKFFSALDKFISVSKKSAGENAVQELIKNSPDIKIGGGDDSRTSLAEERAVALGKRTADANADILKYYRR